MERRTNDQTPNTSTLWLAIGVGAFSVFASFFLAIYFASAATHDGTVSHETPAIEAITRSAN